MIESAEQKRDATLSGNLYIFHAIDIGDEIDLDRLKASGVVTVKPFTLPKHFKNYHVPLAIELPQPHSSPHSMSVKIHNFGAISLIYKVPFNDTLEQLRAKLETIDDTYQEQSITDVGLIFKQIKSFTTKPTFFHTRSSYLVIQVDTEPKRIDVTTLKEQYGSVIASTLRFETETLSEYQKNEILSSAIGYFKGDLIVIDTDAAFVYDPDYEETLNLFEFANIQQLELRYFDRLLDQQLNIIYEGKARKVPLKSYLPFIGTLSTNQIDELGKLKVDISVITERLESNIRLVGDLYFSELYSLLVDKLDLKRWKETIENKLSIIHDVRSVLQDKVDAVREDLLTVLIIVLILTELIVALIQ